MSHSASRTLKPRGVQARGAAARLRHRPRRAAPLSGPRVGREREKRQTLGTQACNPQNAGAAGTAPGGGGGGGPPTGQGRTGKKRTASRDRDRGPAAAAHARRGLGRKVGMVVDDRDEQRAGRAAGDVLTHGQLLLGVNRVAGMSSSVGGTAGGCAGLVASNPGSSGPPKALNSPLGRRPGAPHPAQTAAQHARAGRHRDGHMVCALPRAPCPPDPANPRRPPDNQAQGPAKPAPARPCSDSAPW